MGVAALASNAQGTTQQQTMPERWRLDSSFEQTLPDDDLWWKTFQDPLLDSLIIRAVDQNYNVAMAAHRVEIARQTLLQARSRYYPTLGLSGGWTKSRSSGALSSQSLPATNASYWDLGVNMSWEIDLFGKITAQSRDKKALWQATKAQYVGTMVTLVADVATYYMNVRTNQALLEVAQEHIKSQKRVMEITEARYEAKLASKVDVAQARQVYYSTLASIPSLETSITTTINSIAVLLNEDPAVMQQMLSAPQPMPTHLQIVQAGTPMELLRRRPDIVAAERQLAASALELGIAKKEFLPTLTLDGAIGTGAHAGKDLFKNNTLTYSVAPRLSWTIFDGMSRRAGVVAAKESMQIAIEEYNLTLLTAVQEVDNAMATYLNSLKTIDLDTKVYEQSKEAFELSMAQYKQGLAPFTNVMNSQITMLQYADALVSTRGSALNSLINLYRALGGGYSSELPSAN